MSGSLPLQRNSQPQLKEAWQGSVRVVSQFHQPESWRAPDAQQPLVEEAVGRRRRSGGIW